MSVRLELRILPAVEGDLRLQSQYYLDTAGQDIADRFFGSFEDAIEHILTRPGTGTPFDTSLVRLAGLRSWPLNGFADIRLYYRLVDGCVEAVRLLHGKRDLARELTEEESTR